MGTAQNFSLIGVPLLTPHPSMPPIPHSTLTWKLMEITGYEIHMPRALCAHTCTQAQHLANVCLAGLAAGPFSRVHCETISSKEGKGKRKDLNQDSINKPVAGRKTQTSNNTRGKSLLNLYKNSISEKSFERPWRGRNHTHTHTLLFTGVRFKCVRITLL